MRALTVIYLCDYYPEIQRASSPSPVLSCTVRGLPSHFGYPKRGGLLPHLFNLTFRKRRSIFCGTICPVILSNHRPSFSKGTLLCSVRTFLQLSYKNQRLPGERTATLNLPDTGSKVEKEQKLPPLTQIEIYYTF